LGDGQRGGDGDRGDISHLESLMRVWAKRLVSGGQMRKPGSAQTYSTPGGPRHGAALHRGGRRRGPVGVESGTCKKTWALEWGDAKGAQPENEDWASPLMFISRASAGRPCVFLAEEQRRRCRRQEAGGKRSRENRRCGPRTRGRTGRKCRGGSKGTRLCKQRKGRIGGAGGRQRCPWGGPLGAVVAMVVGGGMGLQRKKQGGGPQRNKQATKWAADRENARFIRPQKFLARQPPALRRLKPKKTAGHLGIRGSKKAATRGPRPRVSARTYVSRRWEAVKLDGKTAGAHAMRRAGGAQVQTGPLTGWLDQKRGRSARDGKRASVTGVREQDGRGFVGTPPHKQGRPKSGGPPLGRGMRKCCGGSAAFSPGQGGESRIVTKLPTGDPTDWP